MKDLIAKLHLDANCALGAIWMHIDAQAARIAELEAQITAASALADTDKLREAISDEQIMRIAGDVRQRNAGAWPGDVAFARAVLASTALQAPVREVPEGWQLVPKEPTGVMKDAGAYALPVDYSSTSAAANAYRAMLAAAPVQQDTTNQNKE